ncbi:MAG: ribokinase [Gammaproteobacteria bacterium]|nr:ribokinase [Gammaproteobacteria bacterium]MDP6733541.1 ribokinase [Gammaproteobacteria bacterium]
MITSFATAITVIGSINTDMVVKTEQLPSPGQTVIGGDFFMSAGGKGGNQAVAAARLGAAVSMVGNLGTDIFGDTAVSKLESEGIDCRFVSRDSHLHSGVALISVDEGGENHIVVSAGANSALNDAHVEAAFDALHDSSIVLIQLEISMATVAKAVALAGERNCRVILDPAPAQELPAAIMKGVYLLTPNESEAELLTGIRVRDENSARQAAGKLLTAGAENVSITLGNQGVFLANAGSDRLISAPDVDAVDTTAAGDCFNGALAVSLASGNSLPESVDFACRAASISVTRLGAQDSMPYAHEIEQ